MHPVLCREHVGGQAEVDEAFKQRAPKPPFRGTVGNDRGRQLAVITDQDEVPATAHDGHEAAGFARLGGLVHQHDGETA